MSKVKYLTEMRGQLAREGRGQTTFSGRMSLEVAPPSFPVSLS